MADVRSPRSARRSRGRQGSRGFRFPGLLAVPVLVAVAAAGCSSGKPAPHASRTAKAAAPTALPTALPSGVAPFSPPPGAVASPSAGAQGQGAYAASELSDALLVSVNHQKVVMPVESGPYGSLAQVKAAQQPMKGLDVSPAKCAQVSLTGFNTPTFASVPAAVAAFKVGSNGITEALLAPSPATAATALNTGIPAGCASYRATDAGKTYTYKITDKPMTGVADAARVINVSVSGSYSLSIWSVVYRAPRFMGEVVIDGPIGSQAVVKNLAAQAYARAASVLG